MYIDVRTVRGYDAYHVTDTISDSEIEEHIAMAQDQVNYYTNSKFGIRPPLSIRKATALITIMLLQNDPSVMKTNFSGDVKSEKIGQIQVTYGVSAGTGSRMLMPTHSIQLLEPFRKNQSYFKGMVRQGG